MHYKSLYFTKQTRHILWKHTSELVDIILEYLYWQKRSPGNNLLHTEIWKVNVMMILVYHFEYNTETVYSFIEK